MIPNTKVLGGKKRDFLVHRRKVISAWTLCVCGKSISGIAHHNWLFILLLSPEGARISERGNKIKHYFSDLLFPAIGSNNFFMLLSFFLCDCRVQQAIYTAPTPSMFTQEKFDDSSSFNHTHHTTHSKVWDNAARLIAAASFSFIHRRVCSRRELYPSAFRLGSWTMYRGRTAALLEGDATAARDVMLQLGGNECPSFSCCARSAGGERPVAH